MDNQQCHTYVTRGNERVKTSFTDARHRKKETEVNKGKRIEKGELPERHVQGGAA